MISKKLLILFALVLFSAYTVHQAERDLIVARAKTKQVYDSIPKNLPSSKPLPVLPVHTESADTLRGAKGADVQFLERKPSEE